MKTLGALHENMGDFDDAQECYEAALELAVRCGDRRQEFNCLHYLGVQASYNYSDWQKALSVWERALGVAVELQCDNAEAHACGELAVVYRNLIPRRPAKESPEEALAAELTKTAVAYYVRAKELKEAYVNGTGVGSGPSSPKSSGGESGSPSSATMQMMALAGPSKSAPAPTSPSKNKQPRVWKFELVHDDKDALLDYGVEPREFHERCPVPQLEYSISLDGNETMLAEEGLLMSIQELASEHPENICLASLDSDYFASLPDELKPALLRCMNSGVTNPDSKMGCYACHPEDYDRFAPFFSNALAKYHGVEMPATHISSWELNSVPGLPEGGVLDLEPLGLMEVRVLCTRVAVHSDCRCPPLLSPCFLPWSAAEDLFLLLDGGLAGRCRCACAWYVTHQFFWRVIEIRFFSGQTPQRTKALPHAEWNRVEILLASLCPGRWTERSAARWRTRCWRHLAF